MGFPSPYKEVGLTADEMMRPRRSRERHVAQNVSSKDGVVAWGHDWKDESALSKDLRTAFRQRVAATAICRWCHQPKFVVEGKACKGKRR